MPSSNTPPDPFESVRNAFDGLGTSEKAAFVIEATFETISQALAETGRRAAATLDDLDIDSWFRAPSHAEDVGAPPPPPPAPKAPVKKPSAKKASAKKPPGSTKTAGKPAGKTPRRRPPADDESDAA